MRSHRKLMTPLGVLGMLVASAAIQTGAGAGVATGAVNPLLDDLTTTVTTTVDTIIDQVPTSPDEMHW
jgi:hypothetical protein